MQALIAAAKAEATRLLVLADTDPSDHGAQITQSLAERWMRLASEAEREAK